MKKKHKHWVAGKKWNTNILHPISQKHRDIETRVRHDLELGKMQRWAKSKGLYLTDSTYELYRKKLKGEK